MGNARVESLLFADDVARLTPSSSGLQRALDRFAAECIMAGMQISTKKTEVVVLSRQKEQCAVSVNVTPLTACPCNALLQTPSFYYKIRNGR